MKRVIPTILAAATSAWLTICSAGCNTDLFRRQPATPANEKIVLRPLRGDPSIEARNLFKMQFYYANQRLRPDTTPSDFWRFLDDTVLPPEKRRLLAANGIRVATGGEVAMERLNDVFSNSEAVRVAEPPAIFAREGFVNQVPLGATVQDLDLMMISAAGQPYGRSFAKATSFLQFRCQAAKEPNMIEVEIVPWVVFGDPSPRWLKTPTGMTLVKEPPRFTFEDLVTTLKIYEGQIVVVGFAPGREMSVGKLFFEGKDGATAVSTAIILQPQLVAAGTVPQGSRVLEGTGQAAPARVAPPTPPPAKPAPVNPPQPEIPENPAFSKDAP